MIQKRVKSGTRPAQQVIEDAALGLPEDAAAIRAELTYFLDLRDGKKRRIGGARHAVYAFYDYDNEPVHVGRTFEGIRQGIIRHFANQNSDTAALNMLDPFEVAEIEVWPLDDAVKTIPVSERGEYLNRAEFTALQKVLRESAFGAVLHEKEMTPRRKVILPQSYRQRIVPDAIYRQRKHPDVRIARRASAVANLARVMSKRDPSDALCQTLFTKARWLERLAHQRLTDPESAADGKKSTVP